MLELAFVNGHPGLPTGRLYAFQKGVSGVNRVRSGRDIR